jgi:hypothetical protein
VPPFPKPNPLLQIRLVVDASCGRLDGMPSGARPLRFLISQFCFYELLSTNNRVNDATIVEALLANLGQGVSVQSNRNATGSRSKITLTLAEKSLVIERSTEEPDVVPVDRNKAGDPLLKPGIALGVQSSIAMASVIRHVRFGIHVGAEQEIIRSDATYPVKNNPITFYELDGLSVEMRPRMQVELR